MTLCGWKIFSKNKQKAKRNQIIKNDIISSSSSSSSSSPIVPSTTKSLIQQKQHKNIISVSSSSTPPTATATASISISLSQPDIPSSSSHLVPLLSQQIEHNNDDDDDNIQNKSTKEIKLESISSNVPPVPPPSQSSIPPLSPKQTEQFSPLFAVSSSSLSSPPPSSVQAPSTTTTKTTISNSSSSNKKQFNSKQKIIKKFTSRTVEDFIFFDKKNKKINKWKFRQKNKSKSDDEDEERGRNRSHRSGNDDNDDDDDNGNPRNKCALKPGHSLMDWIRLGTSGCDLSGTKGVIKPVSSSEVKLHCKKDDAWLIIRGKVYNVTHYMDFHPGGADELMKGVGKDATKMFDEIHAWVNYEQLLSKCYIGPLQNIVKVDLEFQQQQQQQQKLPSSRIHHQKTLSANGDSCGGGGDDGDNIKETFSLIPSSNSAKTSPTKNYNLINLIDSTTKIIPRFDWIQKTSDITLIFYTKSFCNPGLIITCNDNDNSNNSNNDDDNNDNNLNYEIKIIIERIIHQFNIKLLNNVKWPPKLIKQNNESGKIEINLMKSKLELWKNYGLNEYKNYDCINDDINIEYKLIEKYQITHDSYGICLKSCNKIIMIPPIGYHVSVTALVNDKYITRSYTPVPVKYMPTTTTQTTKNCPNNIILSFLIKSYSTGLLAKYITSLSVNNETLSSTTTTKSSPTKNDDQNLLILSQPKGSFILKKLLNHSRIGLLAAGSGITPMLSVLDHLLLRITNRIENIQLLLFNKSENDIWCREKLDLIASSDNRLVIRHILSEPNKEWKGEIGRISKDLILSLNNPKTLNLNVTYCCICGPTQFNDLCLEILKDIGFQSTDLHFFQG